MLLQAAALQELLGLEALPRSGREAQDAARRIGQLVLAAAAPPPLLSQLVAEHLDSLPPARSRFVDVSTGGWVLGLGWEPCGQRGWPAARPVAVHLRAGALSSPHTA